MKVSIVKALSMLGLSVLLFIVTASTTHGKEPNWSAIPSTDMIMIYPGVASWEFLLSDDHRLGGRAIKRKQKKDCRHCHLSKAGELDMKVDEIAAGSVNMKRSHKPFEPKPIPGKKGTMHAFLKAAYDSEYIYIRVEWESKGIGWQKGGPSGKASDRVSLQINKKNPYFKKYGCFIACHNDVNTMPDSPSKRQVLSNPYYKALKRDDVRLYTFYARDSWSKRRTEAELKKELDSGGLIDLWSLELTGGEVKPYDGWIFEDRRWETKRDVQGQGTWAGNRYTVTFKRKLRTSSAYDVQFKDGDVVSMGLAIHEDGAKKRRHYVSFSFTMGLGTEADIKARKLTD